MIEIWVAKYKIPAADQIADGNLCQKAFLPDECKDCKNVFKIVTCGDAQYPASIYGICKHYNLWEKVWANRIREDVPDQQITIMGSAKVIRAFANKIDPAQDGMKCSGSCGNWMPMAAANQADGSFVCYGCRTRI